MRKLTCISLSLLTAIAILICPACKKQNIVRIGVSQCSDDDWRTKMNAEIEREAMFHDNINVEIRSADDSNQKQIADLRYFARNGFDIIIVAPNEAKPITPVIDSIMNAGLPVMVFDRSVTGTNFTAFQGADNDSIGRQVAAYVHQIAPGDKNVIEIYGNPGSTPAQGRHNGFVEGIADYPDIHLLGYGVANWNAGMAKLVADSLLSLYPEANVVYAHNDRMALAAREVADSCGRNIHVIGIDAAPSIGMKAVAEGKIDASFLYPTEGHRLIRTALAIINNEPYDHFASLPASSLIDASNADILLLQDKSLIEETSKMELLKSEVDRYWQAHNVQTAFLYALVGILVLLFVSLFLFLRAFWQKKHQQKLLMEKNLELEIQRDHERELNEQLQEATQSKLMFFTNVSHDLRTPLTLIAEPVKQLLTAPNLDPQQKLMMNLANKNVKILQRLINQVLDFRKYENGRLKLNLSEADLGRLIIDWTDAFNTVARSRHMKLVLDNNIPSQSHFAIDVEKIERVFFNLLSNAFKYTPDNGRITVSTSLADDRIVISVSDNGQGISSEDLPNIFDRFYQADKIHPTGSGIGLSLAKAFVEMHEGTLSVVSEIGKGSVFTVEIPVRHVADEAADLSGNITRQDVNDELARVESPEKSLIDPEIEETESDKPLVLVIDDNADILRLVATLMADSYTVITAPNGSEGLRMAAKYVPDLVICDVMMPVMDGLECCRRIKSELSTSHIPVLMLTACSMDEQRVQGYESGADGYISKPFSNDVLRARCQSLIANRRRILDLYAAAPVHSAHSPEIGNQTAEDEKTSRKSGPALPVGEIDNEFYNRFLEIFREYIGNPEINVDTLAAEMGLGRSQFYRKIKALTNFSPVELIRNIRLKEARTKLLKTEMTVSEIAYAVGFSTPAYFTKCYRETFGETPSDTRANLR